MTHFIFPQILGCLAAVLLCFLCACFRDLPYLTDVGAENVKAQIGLKGPSTPEAGLGNSLQLGRASKQTGIQGGIRGKEISIWYSPSSLFSSTLSLAPNIWHQGLGSKFRDSQQSPCFSYVLKFDKACEHTQILTVKIFLSS